MSAVDELNEREYAVVQAYVNNGYNKTRAYKTVFPDCTDQSAASNGYRLISQEHMQRAITELTDQKITPIKDSKQAIIQEAVEITQEARQQKQYSAAMKGLDTRAKLGGYYDQDEESSQKYLTFINQINNTQINITDKKRLVSNKKNQVSTLGGVRQINPDAISIDNTDINDSNNGYSAENIPEVG